VYAGDPADLSMRAAFPKLYEMERDFGSLIMGAFRRKVEKPDASFPRTFSFRGGLNVLINRLGDAIGEGIRFSSAVRSVGSLGEKTFTVEGEEFDAVVLSTPSYVAADLIDSRDRALAEMLRDVNYPQIAVVVMGFRSDQIRAKLDGFGFLIPSKEKRRILGTLYHSAVFPERAPEGHELLMTFVGGVRSGNSLDDVSDDELKSIVLGELSQIVGLKGQPDLTHIKRWKKAIPQYRIGYEKVNAACSEFEKSNPGIYLCSNFYRGISMGDCVKNAFETADSIEQYLK
jgi:oxygen-dependent protoporphyrinogen oxidase